MRAGWYCWYNLLRKQRNAYQTTSVLVARYHLLELFGENRLYPTNLIAAFRRETEQATTETRAEAER